MDDPYGEFMVQENKASTWFELYAMCKTGAAPAAARWEAAATTLLPQAQHAG